MRFLGYFSMKETLLFGLLILLSSLPTMIYIAIKDKKEKGEWFGIVGYYFFKLIGR